MSWSEQVDEVTRHVLGFLSRRPGRLAAVTVTVPESLSAEEVLEGLREALSSAGHPGVEVSARAAEGPLRLIAVEFER